MARSVAAVACGLCVLAGLTGSAEAASEARYCVRPVPFETMVPDGTVVSRSRQLVEPHYIKLAGDAAYPLVYDFHTYEAPDGQRLNRQTFWSFQADGTLAGPADTGVRTSISGSGVAFGPEATEMIAGRYVTDGPGIEAYGAEGKRWQTRLFTSVDGGIPKPVDTIIQQAVMWPRAIFRSDVLDGFLVSSSHYRQQYSYTGSGSLLRDGHVLPLATGGIDFAADLPSFGVAAILDFSRLSFIDRRGDVTEITRLNSGDDYNGWETVHETRDDGWIYVDGAQYDHAVRIEKVGGAWKATRIVRIEDEDGLSGSVARWLLDMDREQIKRDGLSAIIHAGPCRKFSQAIRRMIFCDRMEELHSGKLVRIGRTEPLVNFLGDATHLGLAIFRGAEGHLYGYDGKTLRPIRGEAVQRGIVHDLPVTGRTVLSTDKGLFEIREHDEELELVKLEVPESGRFFFTPFLATPDGLATVAFTRRGIYAVDEALKPLWSAPDGGQIDTTGHTKPVMVRGWNGILFSTHRHVTGPMRLYLLTLCESPGVDTGGGASRHHPTSDERGGWSR
jgi:hypothetical protein